MKVIQKIILLFLLVISVRAQQFSITLPDLQLDGLVNSELVAEGMAYNLSTTDTLNLMFVRDSVALPDGWSSSLCFYDCAAPWIDTIWAKIAPNSSQSLSLHIISDEIPASGTVRIKFADEAENQSETFMIAATSVISAMQDDEKTLPEEFELYPNYPNPFNNQTVIRLDVPHSGILKLEIFNLAGGRVFSRSAKVAAGESIKIRWNGKNMNGSDLSSGLYFYRAEFDGNDGASAIRVRKLTLLR